LHNSSLPGSRACCSGRSIAAALRAPRRSPLAASANYSGPQISDRLFTDLASFPDREPTFLARGRLRLRLYHLRWVLPICSAEGSPDDALALALKCEGAGPTVAAKFSLSLTEWAVAVSVQGVEVVLSGEKTKSKPDVKIDDNIGPTSLAISGAEIFNRRSREIE
jgi:hypothetical protein